MLSKLVRVIQLAYGDIPKGMPTIEEWSLANAGKACPDSIVASAIVESFKNNYDDWEIGNRLINSSYSSGKASVNNPKYWWYEKPELDLGKRCEIYSCYDSKAFLHNEKKDIVFEIYRPKYKGRTYSYKINEMGIPVHVGHYIVRNWLRVHKEHKTLKDVAAKIKREMEEAEQKWTLAEKLLNMKRNEQGALVPITEINDEHSEYEREASERITYQLSQHPATF